jgi:hypothetical protein
MYVEPEAFTKLFVVIALNPFDNISKVCVVLSAAESSVYNL